jgi:hypothetical protein
LDAKLTGKPELALAEIATDVVVLKMSLGAPKLIVCDCRLIGRLSRGDSAMKLSLILQAMFPAS